MKFVEVAVDIATRALNKPFTYTAPNDCEIGDCVSVPFGNKLQVGYVVGVVGEAGEVGERELAQTPQKIKPIERVLMAHILSKEALACSEWIAEEYGATYLSALKLFLPPRFTKLAQQAIAKNTCIDPHKFLTKDVWVSLLSQTKNAPKIEARASRQRELLEALQDGPMRMQDIKALIPGVASVVKALQKKGYVQVTERVVKAGGQVPATSLSSSRAPKPTELTAGQTEALAVIEQAFKEHMPQAIVIDGITGSGKTEVYLQAIEKALDHNKGALVLVPEISLTAQTVGRFQARFGDAVELLHSRMSEGERQRAWFRIYLGLARVVIGPRSALFAPLKNVGCIVIDEEHEHSYKQESAPRYHAREVARWMAETQGATLILGSATPSEEALFQAYTNPYWERVVLNERPSGAMLPTIDIVDMRGQFKGGSCSLSRELSEALVTNYKAGNKSVLLLNRRGFATFLMCEDCGCVPTCPHCSTSLTYHAYNQRLVCHTCGDSWAYAAWPNKGAKCPNCGSAYLKQVGAGTERIEAELQALLPDVPIIRMDADTTRTKGAHTKLLEVFDQADGAVLLGTQMIAKGLDFPQVTLVGVVNADVSLKMPDFRAPEKTYHLLEQVSGRAGRGTQAGRVIIQTEWPNHPALLAVKEHDRAIFLDSDIQIRKELNYPPYARFNNVVVTSKNERRAEEVVKSLVNATQEALKNSQGVEILGPSACIKEKMQDKHRYHFEVKTPLGFNIGKVLAEVVLATDTRYTSVAIDCDAYNVM